MYKMPLPSKDVVTHSCSKSKMTWEMREQTGNGNKYVQAPFTFSAAQEEALSLWQWRALEKGQEGTQKRLEEPSRQF